MSKINSITFLNNYHGFGSAVRYENAKVLLEKLKASKNKRQKKSLHLGIIDQFIAQSEDYCFWIEAHRVKDKLGIWDFILGYDVNRDNTEKLLSALLKVKNPEELRRFLKLPPIKSIAKLGSTKELEAIDMLQSVKKTSRTILGNRTNNGGMAVRIHNKMKHGMAVLDEGDKIFIRDYTKKAGDRKYSIPLNEPFMSDLVTTMKVAHSTIMVLINLYRFSFIDEILVNGGPKTQVEAEMLADYKSLRKHD